MATQRHLFAELESRRSSEMPRGFRYQENFISEAEEAAAVASLSTLDLKPFEFHGYTGNRRVTSFGLRYDYARRTLERANGFPLFIEELRRMAAAFAGKDVSEIQQCGVNEYPPGAAIGWHKDKLQFGVIVGISLRAPAIMRLRLSTGAGWIREYQTLEPRSIYLLEGEARTRWEHSIPPVHSLRYSLTFRTLGR